MGWAVARCALWPAQETALPCGIQHGAQNARRAAWSSMLHATCAMAAWQNAIRKGHRQRATCRTRRVTCNMQRTAYSMQHATYNIRHAACRTAKCTQHTTCNTRSAASQRELTRTFGGRRREPRRVLERQDAERRRASHKPLLACEGTRGGPAARGEPLCTPPQPRLHFSPARRRLRASPGADVAPLVAAAPAMTGRSPGADVAMRRWRLGIRSCPGARPPHAAKLCPWRTPEAQRLV